MEYTDSRRGRLTTLVRASDATPVTVSLRGVVLQPPHDVKGKTYATIALQPPDDEVRCVDRAIRDRVPGLQYSPLLDVSPDRDVLVLKIDKKALVDIGVVRGERVTVEAGLGNYAAFGYCWVAKAFVKLLGCDE